MKQETMTMVIEVPEKQPYGQSCTQRPRIAPFRGICSVRLLGYGNEYEGARRSDALETWRKQ